MYQLEKITAGELPAVPVFDPEGLKRAIEMRDAGGEPPPLILFRRADGGIDIYDGLKRIAAAKRNPATLLNAAMCYSRGDAERLRQAQQDAGGPVKFWNAQLCRS